MRRLAMRSSSTAKTRDAEQESVSAETRPTEASEPYAGRGACRTCSKAPRMLLGAPRPYLQRTDAASVTG